MSTPLRILLVEDLDDDAQLILRELKRNGYVPVWARVQTADAMRAALEEQTWDVVIADYAMPQFSAPAALGVLKASGQDLPFIIVSGSIGEDLAVAGMKAGAHDYVMKDHLARLVPVIQRELREAEARREKKRAEERLRLLESAVVHSNDAILITAAAPVDPPGPPIVYVNAAFTHMTGYAPEDLMGRSPFILQGPKTEPAALAKVREALRNQQPAMVEMVNYRKDGAEIWVELSISPVLDERNRCAHFVLVQHDITERKQMEKQIEAAKRQYQALVDSLDGIVWESDVRTSRMTFVSRQAEAMFGYPLARWLSEPHFWENHIHPDDRDWAIAFSRRASQEKQNYAFEYRMIAADGRIVWVRDLVTVVVEDNVPVKLRGFIMDVTERKRVESERDAERQVLDALLEELPVGVLFCDTQGRYVRANRAAESILGLARGDVIGTTFSDLKARLNMTGADGSPLADADLPALIAHQVPASDSIELSFTAPGGKARRLALSAAPVVLERSETFGSVVVLADVTEQYIVQEQLRQAQKMESIGTLAGGIAHDFNNLLTVMLGNIALLLRQLSGQSAIREKILRIETAAQRAAELTQQLLAFSRQTPGRKTIVNLNQVVQDTVKLLDRVMGKQIEIRTRLNPSLGHLEADPTQLSQVLMNLCVNARDAMPDGGELVIETDMIQYDENYARLYPSMQPVPHAALSVTDTGVGMDEATKERIFDPFFTTKGPGKGTGLGLSIVYGLVKNHGGVIHVSSEVGRGTSFKLYLPLAAGVAQAGKEAPAPVVGGRETILLVDDEDFVLDVGRAILEEAGYTVLTASSAQNALDLYRNNQRIALVVFDMVMPKMNGRDLYRALKMTNPDVRTLLATGYTFNETARDLVKLGINGFVQKPYTVETLLREVRTVLDRNKAAAEG
jgi:PAS domain S-box-containing protein